MSFISPKPSFTPAYKPSYESTVLSVGSQQESLPDIVVFSHLRWEFVKQRPQHLLERFSKNQRVLFVEEPIPLDGYPPLSAKIMEVSDALTVIQPRIPWNDFSALARSLNRYYSLDANKPIVWLYSAYYMPVLDYINYDLLVYDCMDELSAFKGAPQSLLAQEKELLATADLVFTGGKSLYQAKKKYNSNTYCFPSSVDSKHFSSVFLQDTVIPVDISKIDRPIVGYYGVIDERIDLNLIDSIAQKAPHVSFVMIGPVVKITPNELPQRDNIHYLGGKDYAELPNYLKAFDVAMMPFALNESTRFISPTKTLEYMAALKPIISTPVTDVKSQYQREVEIIETAGEFVTAVDVYLHETTKQRQLREARQRAVLKKTSWDATATAMQKLIYTKLQPSQVSTVADRLLGTRNTSVALSAT